MMILVEVEDVLEVLEKVVKAEAAVRWSSSMC
jgi:hypothetical protein